jgi:uncharacterized protein YlxW (UPF0749 family)
MMKLKKIANFIHNIHSPKQKKDTAIKRIEPRLKQAEIKSMQAKKRQQQNELRELEKKMVKHH